MVCLDLSNYDYDFDMANNPDTWPMLMQLAGVTDVIIGSQWPTKAENQCLRIAVETNINIIGTYAEPNWKSAINLALKYNAKMVGIACEPGGIQNLSDLKQAVYDVTQAGLVPYIYGNRGDLLSLLNGDTTLYEFPLWYANYTGTPGRYFYNSPPPWDPAIHQYSSTKVVAGRVRDHNKVFHYPEEFIELSPEEKRMLEAVYAALCANDSKVIDDWNAMGNSMIKGYNNLYTAVAKIAEKEGITIGED